MKWATFVKQSTITHIKSYAAWLQGNPAMKFIPIKFTQEIYSREFQLNLFCIFLNVLQIYMNFRSVDDFLRFK
jgi:hypothetical protein